jgi:hypothetical protein
VIQIRVAGGMTIAPPGEPVGVGVVDRVGEADGDP